MLIVYYDESGDDGYPKFSSPIFVLTAIYLHHMNWKDLFEMTLKFRRQLKLDYNFPIKLEMHSRNFLLNKNPYKKFGFNEKIRLEIFTRYCEFIGSLDIRVINTAILKPNIANPNYGVLDTSLKYSIQRIENDIDPASNPNEKFLVITDNGRLGKMRQTTRRIQRINYIPSRYSSGSYRREIRAMIEDPLPKDSRESYFIQFSDVVAQVVYYYSLLSKTSFALPKRLAPLINLKKLED